MRLCYLEDCVLFCSYLAKLFLFCITLYLLGWGTLSACLWYEDVHKKNKEQTFLSLPLHPPSVSVLPVLCYYLILSLAGYSGNVDIYSLSLQRYEIRYCKDLTFLMLSNTDL